MRYDRTVIAYHGCDADIAARLLAGEPFKPSENDYDWLGRGIYFWEYGADRAYRFAQDQVGRGRVESPAIIGALIQLGHCFDLMDTRFTKDLADAHDAWKKSMLEAGVALPKNSGKTPDHKLRRLDCAVLNWYLDMATQEGENYDTGPMWLHGGRPGVRGLGHLPAEPHSTGGPQRGLRPRGVQAHNGAVMSDVAKTQGFTLPPHANAEVHKRIMARLAKMTPREVFQTAVRAGIYTADGKLTEHYADQPEEGSGK